MWRSVAEFSALLSPDQHQLAALLQHNPSVSVGVVNLQYEGNVLATQVSVVYDLHFLSASVGRWSK